VRYRVESYDAFNHGDPDCHFMLEGNVDSLPEAISVAERIVDGSLRRHASDAKSAEHLTELYSLFGDVPMILGEPPPGFNPYEYARARALGVWLTWS
jgi:hypothetical protein